MRAAPRCCAGQRTVPVSGSISGEPRCSRGRTVVLVGARERHIDEHDRTRPVDPSWHACADQALHLAVIVHRDASAGAAL